MNAPGERVLKLGVGFSGALVVAGLLVVAIGHSLPVFNVPFEQASAAFLRWCTDEAVVDRAAGDRYLAMFGWHYALQNVGTAIATAGITIGALICGLRRAMPGSSWLRTPARPYVFVLLGAFAMAAYVPGVTYGLSVDADRRYFPSCADSIGIPITAITMTVLVVTPILVIVGGMMTQAFGALPVPLNQWDPNRPILSWSTTIVLGGAIAAATVLWLLSLPASDLIAPSNVVVIYLLASTRAALLSPRQEKADNTFEPVV